MDVDIILGTLADKTNLAGRYSFGTNAIVSKSPLTAVERVLQDIKPGQLGRLRIFDLMASSGDMSMPMSQLTRLQSLFGRSGRVEIRMPDSAPPPAAVPSPPSAGNFGGGFSGNFSGAAGFGGGGFGGATPASAKSLQLKAMLNVPVEIGTI